MSTTDKSEATEAVSGGELVVRTLLRANVRHVFGLHGAHLETIFQSLAQHGVPILDTRHEVAAGHAAEGYARATRGARRSDGDRRAGLHQRDHLDGERLSGSHTRAVPQRFRRASRRGDEHAAGGHRSGRDRAA